MNGTKLFVGLIIAAVIGIIGMYLLPIIVPFVISWTTSAKSSRLLPPGTNVTYMADFWPLILLLVVVSMAIAVVIWSLRGGGGGGMQ